jgi:hypothetical protein
MFDYLSYFNLNIQNYMLYFKKLNNIYILKIILNKLTTSTIKIPMG